MTTNKSQNFEIWDEKMCESSWKKKMSVEFRKEGLNGVNR